jgi:hypothetical protein
MYAAEDAALAAKDQRDQSPSVSDCEERLQELNADTCTDGYPVSSSFCGERAMLEFPSRSRDDVLDMVVNTKGRMMLKTGNSGITPKKSSCSRMRC